MRGSKDQGFKPVEALPQYECPSCLKDGVEVTSSITLRFMNPPLVLDLCPSCHTQAIRQPVTFRLRFNPRSGDHIRESVQGILDRAKAV